MRTELGAFLRDLAPLREAEHLVAAAVGEDRMRPADEAMKAAAARDQLIAGTQIQVIRIAENDLRARFFEVAVAHRLHAPLRADGHERRRLDAAVRRPALAEASGAVGREQREAEP